MIEGFGQELPEAEMHEAIMEAHRLNQELIALQHELIAAARPGRRSRSPPRPTTRSARRSTTASAASSARSSRSSGKAERNGAVKDAAQRRIIAEFCPPGVEGAATPAQVKAAFHAIEERVVREMILDGHRPDGRGPRDLRPIHCEVGVLPCAHGSAIFQRGETQALVTTVLGTGADEQRVDGIMDEFSKKFMLDYNMPSFAVGEVRPIRGPGRREIGHGALAERSVAPILPEPAGIPLHDPRRLRHPRIQRLELDGLGLRRHAQPDGRRACRSTTRSAASRSAWSRTRPSGRHILLTDIIGDEDHFGDMDFKVAGTQRGVTGIQLDLKNQGITGEIVRETLDQAREARLEILRAMLRSIKRPREEISANAPRLIQIQINPEKIGLIIGPGGKTIRRLQDETGAKIDIEDSGIVTLSSDDRRRGRGGPRQDPGDDRRGPGRPDLRGPRHVDQGLRRLRRDPARQGRPGPHQRDVRRLRQQRDRHLPGRRPDARQGHRRGRPGPGQALPEGGPGRARRARPLRGEPPRRRSSPGRRPRPRRPSPAARPRLRPGPGRRSRAGRRSRLRRRPRSPSPRD